MLLFVRTYHKDPSDETMAISAGITDPPNADFDGEQNCRLKAA